MKEKESFILYTEQKAVLDKLTDEQAGKLIKAIYEYEATGNMPELDPILEIIMIPFKTVLDKNAQKWEEERQKRSEAGKKGMKKRWKSLEQEEKDNKNNNVINDITNDNSVINAITKITRHNKNNW